MSELTKDELDAIKARLDGATPGPWSLETLDYKNRIAEICSGSTAVVGISFDSYRGYDYLEVKPADAEFIAHAPTDVARLLAEVERQGAQIDHLLGQSKRLQVSHNCLERIRRTVDSVQLSDESVAECVERLQAENAALRARAVPNYSEQCPTKPGGYWMCKGGGGTPVLIELLHCSGELHVCHTDGMFYPLWKQFNDGWRFAGPIPEPKGGGDEEG